MGNSLDRNSGSIDENAAVAGLAPGTASDAGQAMARDPGSESQFGANEITTPGLGVREAPRSDFDEQHTVPETDLPLHALHALPDPSQFPDPQDTLPPGVVRDIQAELDEALHLTNLTNMPTIPNLPDLANLIDLGPTGEN